MKLSQMCRIAFSKINIFLPPVLFHTFIKIRELRLLKNFFSDSITCMPVLFREYIALQGAGYETFSRYLKIPYGVGGFFQYVFFLLYVMLIFIELFITLCAPQLVRWHRISRELKSVCFQQKI